MAERMLLNTCCHVVIKKNIKVFLRDLFNKVKLDGAQHRMNNLYSTLDEYTAITIPRCFPYNFKVPLWPAFPYIAAIHFPSYNLQWTSSETQPGPLTLIACIPFSPSYHLFAWKWRHVVLFGCLLPWGDMLSARVVLNRAWRTNKEWNPYAVRGRNLVLFEFLPQTART
jgi:hypothetical protein